MYLLRKDSSWRHRNIFSVEGSFAFLKERHTFDQLKCVTVDVTWSVWPVFYIFPCCTCLCSNWALWCEWETQEGCRTLLCSYYRHWIITLKGVAFPTGLFTVRYGTVNRRAARRRVYENGSRFQLLSGSSGGITRTVASNVPWVTVTS